MCCGLSLPLAFKVNKDNGISDNTNIKPDGFCGYHSTQSKIQTTNTNQLPIITKSEKLINNNNDANKYTTRSYLIYLKLLRNSNSIKSTSI